MGAKFLPFKGEVNKPYRPSNGTEGDMFMRTFCHRCEKDREWREHERNSCLILGNAFAFNIGEEGFPAEWVYDDEGEPSCTAFELSPVVSAGGASK